MQMFPSQKSTTCSPMVGTDLWTDYKLWTVISYTVDFFLKKYVYIYTGILIIVHVCVYIYFCLVDGWTNHEFNGLTLKKPELVHKVFNLLIIDFYFTNGPMAYKHLQTIFI